jgi:hypothetical protein
MYKFIGLFLILLLMGFTKPQRMAIADWNNHVPTDIVIKHWESFKSDESRQQYVQLYFIEYFSQ